MDGVLEEFDRVLNGKYRARLSAYNRIIDETQGAGGELIQSHVLSVKYK